MTALAPPPPPSAPLAPSGPAVNVVPATRMAAGGSMLSGRALALTVLAIAVGAVGMHLSGVIGHRTSMEPEAQIRYAIVITVGVYVVVGVLVFAQLRPGVRLRWSVGSPARSVLIGAAVGGTLSALLLAVVSAASGHLAPDPRIVTMMSEGDLPHLLVAFALTCVCAPLIEEILFRGLLLESMRRHGSLAALLVSAAGFAVWHLNPAALRYYAVMGGVLGGLYLWRGLVSSMAAHATFNGLLTVAALAVVLTPATVVHAGHLSIAAPGGWSTHAAGDQLALSGPSGSALFVFDQPMVGAPSSATILQRLQDGEIGDVGSQLTVNSATSRRLPIPAGDAVAVDVVADGHDGTVVYLPLQQEAVEVVFLSGGSARARADFPGMLRSLRVG